MRSASAMNWAAVPGGMDHGVCAWTSIMNSVRVTQAWLGCPATCCWATATMEARNLPVPTPWTALYRSASCAAAPSTVMVKLVLTGLLRSLLSVAVQVTVVVPIGNTDPEGGLHTAAGGL